MAKNNRQIVVETLAFSVFLKSHSDLTGFCILAFNPILNIWSNISPDDLQKLSPQDKEIISPLANIAQTGKSVAANLAVVYLVAIMEGYVKDVITEMISKHIRRMNRLLLGEPIPTSEDESFLIEIQLDGAEKNEGSPFFLFSDVAREYILTKLSRTPVEEGIKILKKYFQVNIKDDEPYKEQWDEIKFLRNCIVHNKGRAIKDSKSPLHNLKAGDEIIISPEVLSSALEDVFNFAGAIEYSIYEARRLSQST